MASFGGNDAEPGVLVNAGDDLRLTTGSSKTRRRALQRGWFRRSSQISASTSDGI